MWTKSCVLALTVGFFALAALAYFPADGLAALLVVRVCHGLAFEAAIRPPAPSSSRSSPPAAGPRAPGTTGRERRSPPPSARSSPSYSWTSRVYDGLFVASAVASFLALGAAVWLRAPRTRPQAQRSPKRRSAPIEVGALPIASFVLVGALAYSGIVLASAALYHAVHGGTRALARVATEAPQSTPARDLVPAAG